MLKNVTTQEHLKKAINALFPNIDVLTNVRRQGNVVSPHTGLFLELDFWLPELKIAFEFQDHHHYVSTWYPQPVLERMKLNDEIKKSNLENRGETLVIVPCWWDGSVDSLRETIREKRPELVGVKSPHAIPIDTRPPDNFFTEWKWMIPDVGELTLASPAQGRIPDNNWIYERYKGVRACWHPTLKTLFSRYAKPIPIPASFLRMMGNTFMDGDLWFGRSSYPILQKSSNGWDLACYCISDLPSKKTRELPFEERFAMLVETKNTNEFVMLIPQFLSKRRMVDAKSDVALTLLYASGDGVILRLPSSLYEGGRTHSLVHLEAPNKEALVVSVRPPFCKLLQPNREIIQATFEGCDRNVQIGEIVQFSCASFVSGTPQKAAVNEVLPTWNCEPPGSMNFEKQEVVEPVLRKPRGHWTGNEGANIRLFFDKFARARGLDSLIAESWYSFSLADVFSAENGYSATKHYKSLRRALMDVYPEVSFELSKWKKVSRMFWNTSKNRRAFFDAYARKKGFDPLVPENWYNISKTEVTRVHKGSSVLSRHGYSVVKALLSIYPSIGLDESKFTIMKKGYWGSQKNRKHFFDAFAARRNFDPLLARNWYAVRYSDLLHQKGGKSLLSKFTNIFWAILDSYPNIGLQKDMFPRGKKKISAQ